MSIYNVNGDNCWPTPPGLPALGLPCDEPMAASEGFGLKGIAKKSIEQTVNQRSELWANPEEGIYIPVAKTVNTLPPGVYYPRCTTSGSFFQAINFSSEGLIRFEDSNIDAVINEISTFWTKEALFKELKLPFKRGILLHGVPGGGKSCALKLIINDIIALNGVAICFTEVNAFTVCMSMLRKIHPYMPVVVIMEDLDSLLNHNNVSNMLNLLDGVQGFENIIYLATTNYAEKLEPRVANRPSRFDKRYHIGYPSDGTRETYLKHLLSECKSDILKAKANNIDFTKWVKDTRNFTFAHLKELFISHMLFDHEYSEALQTIKDMSKKISSSNGESNGAGFKLNRDDYRDY